MCLNMGANASCIPFLSNLLSVKRTSRTRSKLSTIICPNTTIWSWQKAPPSSSFAAERAFYFVGFSSPSSLSPYSWKIWLNSYFQKRTT